MDPMIVAMCSEEEWGWVEAQLALFDREEAERPLHINDHGLQAMEYIHLNELAAALVHCELWDSDLIQRCRVEISG